MGNHPNVSGKVSHMSEQNRRHDLDALSERLQAARGTSAQNPAQTATTDGAGMAIGFRIVVEMIAALVTGFGAGYVLDQWLGTKPWMMIVFFFLGTGAAFMNLMRVARQLEQQKESAAAGSRTER